MSQYETIVKPALSLASRLAPSHPEAADGLVRLAVSKGASLNDVENVMHPGSRRVLRDWNRKVRTHFSQDETWRIDAPTDRIGTGEKVLKLWRTVQSGTTEMPSSKSLFGTLIALSSGTGAL